MEIKSTFINDSGEEVHFVYRDIDSEVDFRDSKIHSVCAYCFFGDKLVVVYAGAKDRWRWAPPGGGVEEGESAQEAVVREVMEESNMKVVKHRFIGYQDIFEPTRVVSQTRSVCIVEPYGDFVADPDGDITEIRLIDPKDYKKYFDWGAKGDRLMERALEAVAQMRSE